MSAPARPAKKLKKKTRNPLFSAPAISAGAGSVVPLTLELVDMTYSGPSSQMRDLPDPFQQPEFYTNVPTKRLIAFVIDSVIIFALTLLALPFTAFLGLFFFPVLFIVLGFAYRVITLANGSATLGMRFVAIEFRSADGHRFDLGLAFMHCLGLSISLSVPIIQVVSIVLMLTGARGQGLTDHALGTVALNKRR